MNYFWTCLWNFKFHIQFESWTLLGFRSWIISYGNLTMMIMMTWPLAWNYCSMILGVLQISSTTRNLVPRFKRWSKGERFGYEILTDLLGLGYSSRRGWSIKLMPSFLCLKSSWWSRHPFLKISIVLTEKIRGKTWEGWTSTHVRYLGAISVSEV